MAQGTAAAAAAPLTLDELKSVASLRHSFWYRTYGRILFRELGGTQVRAIDADALQQHPKICALVYDGCLLSQGYEVLESAADYARFNVKAALQSVCVEADPFADIVPAGDLLTPPSTARDTTSLVSEAADIGDATAFDGKGVLPKNAAIQCLPVLAEGSAVSAAASSVDLTGGAAAARMQQTASFADSWHLPFPAWPQFDGRALLQSLQPAAWHFKHASCGSRAQTIGIGFIVGLMIAGVLVGTTVYYFSPKQQAEGAGAAAGDDAMLAFLGQHPRTPAEWTYDTTASNGPQNWGRLLDTSTGLPLFPACAPVRTGRQSPIDIAAAAIAGATAAPINRTYTATTFAIDSRVQGHPGFQVRALDGVATWMVDGAPYDLVQLHFHAPSEHTINGARFPLEAHFVHRNAATQALAVFGVVFNISDAPNPYMTDWWLQIYHAVPSITGLNLSGLIGDTVPQYYRYNGSLTTPPCSEGVKWFVTLSASGVDDLQSVIYSYALNFELNARPTQAANGRVPLRFTQSAGGGGHRLRRRDRRLRPVEGSS